MWTQFGRGQDIRQSIQTIKTRDLFNQIGFDGDVESETGHIDDTAIRVLFTNRQFQPSKNGCHLIVRDGHAEKFARRVETERHLQRSTGGFADVDHPFGHLAAGQRLEQHGRSSAGPVCQFGIYAALKSMTGFGAEVQSR